MPRCPTLLLSLIHDDTTLADRTFLPSTPSNPPPAEPDPHITPLPYAIVQLADIIGSQLRLSIAPHKTLLFQPPLPPGDSRALANLVHLFPTASRLTDKSFVLAGCPVGTRSGIALTLVDHLKAFHAAVQKLLDLPGLHMQLRLLVLNLCCRPSSSFAHLLRHLPPTPPPPAPAFPSPPSPCHRPSPTPSASPSPTTSARPERLVSRHTQLPVTKRRPFPHPLRR